MTTKSPAKVGARPLFEVPMGRTNVMLDAMTRRKLLVLGDKNLSAGIRRAADVAYEEYQRVDEEKPPGD